MTNTILEVKGISKKFYTFPVLADFSMSIEEGSFVAIRGVSGCGKSTLLNIVGLLDHADSGEIFYQGRPLPKPFSRGARKMLESEVGYLFQNFALIDEKSVEENVMVALQGKKDSGKIKDALKLVGLEGFEKKKIYECSGGEQQRVAIARLLLKTCNLILCDEPTGSLDEKNREEVYNLLRMLQEQGKTIIVVTHDSWIVDKADTCIYMENLKQDKL